MALVLGMLLLASGLAATAQAQETGAERTSRVLAISIGEVNGTAQIMSRAQVGQEGRQPRVLADAWEAALPKTNVQAGDHLRTGPDSSMTLHLTDGTVVTMSGDSLVVVEELKSARGTTPKTVQLKLEKGKIRTQQTTKILGQTNQVIRTDNGSINCGIGEVEVWREIRERKKYVLLASLAARLPLLAQGPNPNDSLTYVEILSGSAGILPSGVGSMIAMSFVLPEMCQAEDGVRFQINTKGTQTRITKLEGNRLRVQSQNNIPVQVMAATEGNSNQLRISAEQDTKVDIEGVPIAQQRAGSILDLLMHELLTVGLETSDVILIFNCSEEKPEGLNFDILASDGDIVLLRESLTTSLGEGVRRGPDGTIIPSHGAVPPVIQTPTPTTRTPLPTATPTETPTEATPTPEAETPTPTATPTEGEGPPPPVPGPLTDVFPAAPVITALGALAVNAGGCGGGQDLVSLEIHYNDMTPSVVGGELRRQHPTAPAPVVASFTLGITSPPYLTQTNYHYTYSGGESADMTYWFCFDPAGPLNPHRNFDLWIEDADGNASNVLNYTIP